MGTTIGNVLISYDVSAKNAEVTAALLALNYLDNFILEAKSKVYYLPTSTLWHKTKTSDQAIADINKVCADLNVTLESVVAVKANEFIGI